MTSTTEHLWKNHSFRDGTLEYCVRCGAVRVRPPSVNGPCPGHVRVTLRSCATDGTVLPSDLSSPAGNPSQPDGPHISLSYDPCPGIHINFKPIISMVFDKKKSWRSGLKRFIMDAYRWLTLESSNGYKKDNSRSVGK